MAVVLAFAGALLAPGPGASARQGLVGVQANWKDLETWSRLTETARERELGLGLHPIGAAVVAFLGRLSTADPGKPPPEIQVHAAAAYLANPAVLRTRTLVFLADAGTDRQVTLDLGATLLTDDISPGGVINNGLGPMRAADFVRLGQSRTLTANILGFEVIFRPDQIRAMQAFAVRLHLAIPSGSRAGRER